MTDYLGAVEQAIAAVTIRSMCQFSWFGEPAWRLPFSAAGTLPETVLRGYLVSSLQMCLYRNFYGKGQARPAGPGGTVRRSRGLGRLVGQLREANTGQGYWASGWRVGALGPEAIAVHGPQVQLWAQPQDVRAGAGHSETLTPGTDILLRFDKDSAAASPGFYMAWSDTDWAEDPAHPVVRLYWHLTPGSALTLMHEATRLLNGAAIAFRLKVLSDPSGYTRCDAGVLYLKKRDSGRVIELLAPAYEHIAPDLGRAVPAFTKELAPGLGLAEDPGNGDSFGLHRCGLLAEALVRAHEQGVRGSEGALGLVIDRFLGEAISLDRPYLQPGSQDEYLPLIRSARPSLASAETTTSSDPACEAAAGIAHLLCNVALWEGDLCNWIARSAETDSSRSDTREVYRALGPGIVGGTAGIAIFLAEYSRRHPDETYWRTALGAICHALSYRQGAMSTHLGYREGGTGVALGAVRVARILGEEGLLQRADDLLTSILKSNEARTRETVRDDPLSIVALLLLAESLGRHDLQDRALSFGRELVICREAPCPPTSPRRATATRRAESSAMQAYVLLELFGASGDTEFLEAADLALKQAARPVTDRALRDDRMIWTAMTRMRAWELTAREQYRAEAQGSLWALAEVAERAMLAGSAGLVGAAEVLARSLSTPGLADPARVALLKRIEDAVAQQYTPRRRAETEVSAGAWEAGLFLLGCGDSVATSLRFPS